MPQLDPPLDHAVLLVDGDARPLLAQGLEPSPAVAPRPVQGPRGCPASSRLGLSACLAIFGQQTAQAVDLGGAVHQLLAHAMSARIACCSSLLIATVLTPGCCTSIARASCASFLLPRRAAPSSPAEARDLVRGAPGSRAIASRRRPPSRPGTARRLAKCSRNFARISRVRFAVSISTQCSWNTRFAVSTPTTVRLHLDPPVCL